MLQQTQVERVIPYYANWLTEYPTVEALAKAPLGKVLRSWQGLGYNRRAKMLHEAAKIVVKEHGGKMPRTLEALEALPGIGHYTARAVLAFACNMDVVFIETNLRTAVTHHFFPSSEGVRDSDVLAILEKALPKGESQTWYSALMDYGAHLKSTGVRINSKAKHYKKQSTFEGSDRQVRGAILRLLTERKKTKQALITSIDKTRSQIIEEQIAALLSEGLIIRVGRSFSLPE